MDHAIKVLREELGRHEGGDPRRTSAEIAQMDSIRLAISALETLRDGWLQVPETFEDKIAHAINCHSMENGSDTPDFILAGYMKRCLENFGVTVSERTKWYAPSDGSEDDGSRCIPPTENVA